MTVPPPGKNDHERVSKRSYTIPCSTPFRDAVETLAARKGGNVADLARAMVMTLDAKTLTAFPDPGGPARDDRETVHLKSGASAGRPWKRKPRLQVRMAPGLEVITIRKALGLALALADGSHHLEAVGPAFGNRPGSETDKEIQGLQDELAATLVESQRLLGLIDTVSFQPLAQGVQTRDEALFVLGFAPGSRPDRAAIRSRFRQLATIHHPDGGTGSHARMTQLNEAMALLR